MIIRNVS